MALIQASRAPQSGGGGGGTSFGFVEVVRTTAFASGALTIATTSGSSRVANAVWVNMEQKQLMAGRDFSWNGSQVTILFADDPGNYSNGEIIFQVTYGYNA